MRGTQGRALVLSVLWALVVGVPLGAQVRWFAPVFLKLGAVNEVYGWDEAPVGPFTVEVIREGSPKPLTIARGFSVDRPLPVLGASNRPLKWSAALVALDAQTEPGPVILRFVGGQKEVLAEIASEIHPRSFPVEEISLEKTMSELRSKPDPRKDREAAAIWVVYQKFEPQFSWPGARFLLPVDPASPTSAQFGDIRKYLYSDGKSDLDYHRGTDFAVPVGTLVSVPAPGTVVLVADRMLTGTTVVVEHAPGVYSVYFHLSRALVKVGKKVEAGDRLGLSGATGLVTGPHLHWEVRVDGVSVDPLDLVIDGLLDTKVVSAVISSVERPIH